MAVIDQTIPQRAADVEKTKLLAQMLMRNSQQGQDPYAQTGGPYSRVIPVHPLAAALQGLQAGFGAYYANQAQDQQAELEQQKLNATREAFAGGNMDVEKLAGSGAVDAGTLAKLLMGKSGQEGPVYDYLNTNQGVLRADKRSKFAEVVTGADGQPYRIAGADPNLQGQIQNAKTANTGYKLADESGREGLFSGQQANPAAFGQGQQAPQAPQQAQFQFNDVDNLRAFLQSDEGKSLLAGKNPSDAATGQGGAEQFAGRADDFAKGQGQSNQVWGKTGGYGGGMVKGPSIKEKTSIEQGIKTDEAIREARAKADIDVSKKAQEQQQTQQIGANKTLEAVNNMLRYLYPEGKPVRNNEGRLVPPSEQMVLGTGPIDRAKAAAQQIGIHSDLATNTERVKSYGAELARAALGGSLGAGVSNADVEFINKATGILQSAQDLQTLYSAIADLEQKAKEIQTRGQGLKPGHIEDGHRYIGGNPADPASWEPVQ